MDRTARPPARAPVPVAVPAFALLLLAMFSPYGSERYCYAVANAGEPICFPTRSECASAESREQASIRQSCKVFNQNPFRRPPP